MHPIIRSKWIARGTLSVLAALVLAGTVRAVSVSPLALYINGRERSTVLTLYNDGTRPEEIQIGFAFGYPRSDSLGNLSVALADTAPAGEPSSLGWISAFPRRVVLQPGERQAVRVLVEPPPGLADGEYWARVLIKSKGGQPPIEQKRPDGITVQIDVETTVAIPASFRLGTVRTGIAIDAAHAQMQGDSVQTRIDLSRTGNAAFLGRLQVELLDAAGNVVGSRQEHLGVYHGIRRMLLIGASAGTHPTRVRITIDNRRDDLPPEGPLPAAPISQVIPIQP